MDTKPVSYETVAALSGADLPVMKPSLSALNEGFHIEMPRLPMKNGACQH